jgi:uncharacterized protein involved in response to NO
MPSEKIMPTEKPGPTKKPTPSLALFTYGFRPFFICAGAYGVLSVFLWGLAYPGWITLDPGISLPAWHAHEMIFGYTAAVICGFFLTAVPNWTGVVRLHGLPLAGLVTLWVLGRVAPWVDGPAHFLFSLADMALLPLTALWVASAIWQVKVWKHLIPLALLLLLAAANIFEHLGFSDRFTDGNALGRSLGVDTVILMIVLIGGRILPTFTRSALATQGAGDHIRSDGPFDKLAILSVFLVLLLDAGEVLAGGLAFPAAIAALIAAGLVGFRLRGWRTLETLNQPILWSLHLGYVWIVIGLGLKGLAFFIDALPAATALHALTIGAIGGMTLAMISRVALGHTGRALVTPRSTTAAYILVSVAALTRLAAPLAPENAYVDMIALSGIFWCLAFAIYTIVFAPILARPRPDGRPG